jgi:hypothetical protein
VRLRGFVLQLPLLREIIYTVSILIGLGYRAGHGKDLAARSIIEARGGQYDIRSYSFAGALKKEYTEACHQAGDAYALIETMRVTHNLPKWVQYEIGADMTDPLCPYGKQRTLLQFWGSEFRRAADPFYWVKELHKQIVEEQPTVALITDLRFPNEALYVKLNKGYTVEVRREGYVDLLADGHNSEHALSGYPFDICLSIPHYDDVEDYVSHVRREAVDVFDLIASWQITDVTENDFAAAA